MSSSPVAQADECAGRPDFQLAGDFRAELGEPRVQLGLERRRAPRRRGSLEWDMAFLFRVRAPLDARLVQTYAGAGSEFGEMGLRTTPGPANCLMPQPGADRQSGPPVCHLISTDRRR